MNRKLAYPLAALTAALLLGALLIANKPLPPAENYTPQVPTVRVVSTLVQSETLTVRSQGTVQPRTESQLIPEVSGRVVWMSPALVSGGSFEADEVLLQIDPADYQNTVDKSKAALSRAKAEQGHAADELRRLQKLLSQNLASQSQVDESERRFQVAQANYTEARINLQQAELDLTRTRIHAPYPGRVRSEKVDTGQFIARGTAIATLYAMDYMEVRLPVASNQLSYLDISTNGDLPEPRSAVMITGEFGKTQFIWDGELVRTEAEVDASSRLFYGVARIENADSATVPPLIVGLFVQAEIEGRVVDNLVRLPRTALRDRNQVLIVDDDDRLRFRQVTVFRLEHDEVLISKGLGNGERVCISPLQTVVDGMRVKAIEA